MIKKITKFNASNGNPKDTSCAKDQIIQETDKSRQQSAISQSTVTK